MKLFYKVFFSFFSMILVFASFYSCSGDFLDQKPYSSVSPKDALSSENDLLIALRGIYSDLRDANLYGRTIPVYGDLYADNTYISIKNSGKYLSFDNYTISSNNDDFSGIWSTSYNTILRANNLIDANVDLNTINVKQYRGEAYALRALTYFNLVRIYARPYLSDSLGLGVPIVLHYDPSYKPKRSPIYKVYNQIIADLDSSRVLQTEYINSARFSPYAAILLEAKVFLYMGKYKEALDLALRVIKDSGFTLLKSSDLLNYWSDPSYHSQNDKRETLFEVDADETLNISFNELACCYNQNSSGYLLANDSLFTLFSNNDCRKRLMLIGNREQGENRVVLVEKYKNYTGDFDNKKILRMSEAYLIAAECYNRLSDDTNALLILNKFMSERDSTFTYKDTRDKLLEDIITERRKEFAFEGDRYFDLNRLMFDVNRIGGNYSVRFLSIDDYRRIAPIPLNEINANTNISSEQNPGY